MAPQGNSRTDIEGVSDEDLLIQMSLQKSEPDEAKEAWKVFYQRHIKFVHGHCWEVLNKHLNGRYEGSAIWDLASDLVTEIMLKAYSKAEQFRSDGACEPDQMRWRARAWLGTIAENTAYDWLNQRGSAPHTILIVEVPEDVANDDVDADPFLDCVSRLVDGLQDKERMVILAYMDFLNTKKGTGRISNDESKELARFLGLTTASLRQVKLRTLKKLKEQIETKCMGKSETSRS